MWRWRPNGPVGPPAAPMPAQLRQMRQFPDGGRNLAGEGAQSYITTLIRFPGAIEMKAMLRGHVIAESDDVIECGGYQYFPRAAVRMNRLEKTAKTAADLECPHGVQFYDVVVDGERHQRAAWSYEAPQPRMRQVADRFGFWEAVQVG